MLALSVPEKVSDLCYSGILATKDHEVSNHPDLNFLIDADLAILGRDWDDYYDYTQKIRKEYRIYPDFLYRKGRKNVLQQFLKMESIFKTKHFSIKYEEKAKNNLHRELNSL